MENESSDEKIVVGGIEKNGDSGGDNVVRSLTAAELKRDTTPDNQKGDQEELQSKNESSDKKNIVSGDNVVSSPTAAYLKRDTPDIQKDDQEDLQSEMKSIDISEEHPSFDNVEREESSNDQIAETRGFESEDQEQTNSDSVKREKNLNGQMVETKILDSEDPEETNPPAGEILGEEKEVEPIFDGTEIPGMEANRNFSTRSSDFETEAQGSAWPDKAAALTNFVKEKGVVAVTTVLRRFSGKKDEDGQSFPDEDYLNSGTKEEGDSAPESKTKVLTPKSLDRSLWNPLNYIKIARDADAENKTGEGQDQHVNMMKPLLPLAMRGRVLLYTRLGCQESRQIRLFLRQKRVRYAEINIDVYPSRKFELERIAGSAAVPKVFFNENLIGGLNELLLMEKSGKLNENINELITKEPPHLAPLPPLSGEDDVSSTGMVDELAVIVRKMKEFIVFRDRFYKMRRFTNCFLGSEAVDFLSEDQYLERQEAIEFGRKLASKLFFQHVLEENVFEDGNHLYRLLDHDPIVSSQCHNFPRGTTIVKPRPIVEIASRLRFLSFAIFEAYTTEDGKHVDYRSIHGSEEFARYLRTVEELQRVELQDMPREDKLAFFINLYNMMAIHAILVALPYPEPLVHFALVCGTRSGPALRCYSPGDIDKELMEAARNFLRNGGLIVDGEARVVSANKIFRWYPGDFGKNEVEVLKHAANYLEPAKSEELLELLATTQLKVTYQPYDWDLNY
ncbi:uncharacterized protein LOC122078269 isoform X2 [Macadamia integrifolia]|uniref:uncharacterized protein LOC122078269 isoform X2 n=1 Tax=Macadamia integrifolia TaxID=60698 RepID=UPI001C5025AC|nr:uncharacterized protein LOC122078269 isoform X2 [Macadamia integrifolia]